MSDSGLAPEQAQADQNAKVEAIGRDTRPEEPSPGTGPSADFIQALTPLYVVKGDKVDELAHRIALLEEPVRGYWFSATYEPHNDITLVELAYSLTLHNVREPTLFKDMDWRLVDYDTAKTVNLDDIHLLDQELGTLSSNPQYEVR